MSDLEQQCEEMAGLLQAMGLPLDPAAYDEEFTAHIREAARSYRAMVRGDSRLPTATDTKAAAEGDLDAVARVCRAGFALAIPHGQRGIGGWWLTWDAEDERFHLRSHYGVAFHKSVAVLWPDFIRHRNGRDIIVCKPGAPRLDNPALPTRSAMMDVIGRAYTGLLRYGDKSLMPSGKSTVAYMAGQAVIRGYIMRQGDGYAVTRRGIAALIAEGHLTTEAAQDAYNIAPA